MTDLIRQLRELAASEEIADSAADAIEAQAAEIEELKAKLDADFQEYFVTNNRQAALLKMALEALKESSLHQSKYATSCIRKHKAAIAALEEYERDSN